MPDYGVVIGWVPGNYSQRVQVSRTADDGSGNPDTTTTELVTTVLPDQTYYYDALPPDNGFRHYRVRHILTGLIDGAWSSYVRAKPKLVPPQYLNSVGDQTFTESSALPATYTVGDVLYASAASILSKRAAVATGNLLISQGAATAPAWGKLASTHLSGDYSFPGTATIAGLLTASANITATGASANYLKRTTATNNAVVACMVTYAQLTSGSLADGFGPSMLFQTEDGSATVRTAGRIAAIRSGADTTYDLYLHAVSAGSLVEVVKLGANLLATFAGAVTMVGLVTAQAGLTVSGGSISASGIAATVGPLTATSVLVNQITDNGVAITLDRTDTTAMQVYSAISNSGVWYWYDNTTPRYVIEYTKATNVLRLLAETGTVAMGALTATTVTGTGLFLTPASASGGAGLRLPHGAAPSSPTDGDIWTTTAGLYVRINGGTVGPLT